MFDENEKDGVIDNRENVADNQAGVDAEDHMLARKEDEEGYDEIGQRMKNGDDNEEPPDTQALSQEREDKALDDKCNYAIT